MRAARLRCDLYGSRGATDKGHGGDKAVLLGLAGHQPDTVYVEAIPSMLKAIHDESRMPLPEGHAKGLGCPNTSVVGPSASTPRP